MTKPNGITKTKVTAPISSIKGKKSDSTQEVKAIPDTSGTEGNLCPKVLMEKGYSIGEAISEGGFSRVYKASGRVDGKQIEMACKIIKLSDVPVEWKERALKNELKIVSQVKHPNIVTIYEITKTHRNAYIFMELAVDTVTNYIRRRGKPLTELQGWYWIKQLMEAVKYLHERHVAHRDLKIDNILIDKDHNIKLTDFGFATLITDRKTNKIQLSSTSCGTKEYMAPELSEGEPYDPRPADVYASGIVLYEILIGRNPFPIADPSLTDTQLFMMKKQSKWFFPRGVIISDETKEVIQWMMSPDPKDRPTAAGFLVCSWSKRQPVKN